MPGPGTKPITDARSLLDPEIALGRRIGFAVSMLASLTGVALAALCLIALGMHCGHGASQDIGESRPVIVVDGGDDGDEGGDAPLELAPD